MFFMLSSAKIVLLKYLCGVHVYFRSSVKSESAKSLLLNPPEPNDRAHSEKRLFQKQ